MNEKTDFCPKNTHRGVRLGLWHRALCGRSVGGTRPIDTVSGYSLCPNRLGVRGPRPPKLSPPGTLHGDRGVCARHSNPTPTPRSRSRPIIYGSRDDYGGPPSLPGARQLFAIPAWVGSALHPPRSRRRSNVLWPLLVASAFLAHSQGPHFPATQHSQIQFLLVYCPQWLSWSVVLYCDREFQTHSPAQ